VIRDHISIVAELQRLREHEALQRANLGLHLENTLLRSQRTLPPGDSEQDELRQTVEALQREVRELRERIDRLESR